MNIHPLFVHFPIGIIAAYTVLELLPYLWARFGSYDWVRPAKIFLIVLAVLSFAFVFPTGEMSKDRLVPNSDSMRIAEVHEKFAALTFTIYALLALAYLTLEIADRRIVLPHAFARVHTFAQKAQPYALYFVSKYAVLFLVLFGVVSITITGGLGAAIVYGPEVEPLVTLIYNTFVGPEM